MCRADGLARRETVCIAVSASSRQLSLAALGGSTGEPYMTQAGTLNQGSATRALPTLYFHNYSESQNSPGYQALAERDNSQRSRETATLISRPARLGSARLVYCALVFVILPCLAFGQSSVPASNPQALALASQTIAKLVGSTSLGDVTLIGDVTWSAGDPDTGTITLKALGTGESRMDLALSGGTRSEIRNSSTGSCEGKWVAEDGTTGPLASQNTATDPVWFFPAFSSLAQGGNVVLAYVGEEARNGQTVQHLRSYRAGGAQPTSVMPAAEQLSIVDFYLDATTGLPVATQFNEHPDNNAATNIAVEVDFSNYQSVNGVLVPMHIQRMRNGSPLIDITVTEVELNSGLSLSQFSIE